MARTKKQRPGSAPHDVAGAAADPLSRLYHAVEQRRASGDAASRTGKLLAAGPAKMAQKLVEEAAEVAIDAVRGENPAVIREAADLLYNLVILLNELDIPLYDIWQEMARRERLFGIAEKVPKRPWLIAR
jgi:phosphoribosyl-ATP pyrophosphohydrolase